MLHRVLTRRHRSLLSATLRSSSMQRQVSMRGHAVALAAVGAVLAASMPLADIQAAQPFKPNNGCRNSGPGFEPWLAQLKREAASKGVTAHTIGVALDGMTLDQGIINRDRGGQKVFTQSFIDFSSKLANPSRFKSSLYKYGKHKELFKKVCAACHQLGGVGHPTGPNLATMRNRGAWASNSSSMRSVTMHSSASASWTPSSNVARGMKSSTAC